MQLRKSICYSVLSLAAMIAGPAFADNRYVSKSGADSPTCGSSNANPCLAIGTAIANATAGGGYNRIIITSNGGFAEAITINSSTELDVLEGLVAFIAPPAGQSAITINAGVGDNIRMFNIYLAGNSGAALDGVRFNSGANLELHNAQIRGFGGVSVNFKPSGGSAANLLIDRSEIADSSTQCVMVQPNAMQANALVTNSLIHNCGTLGIRSDSQSLTTGFVKSHLINTRVFNIGASAVSALSGAGGGSARVTVEDSTLINAVTGAVANGAAATVVLNRATINGTTTGMSVAASGTIFSFGNNSLIFNGTNGPSPSPAPLQ